MRLLLLLVWASVASAIMTRVDMTTGAYTLVLLYDNARPFPSRVLHVSTVGKSLYAVAVEDGLSDQIVCRRVSTRQIIVTPRGCDDASSVSGAVVDHFCEFGGELALRKARDATREQWTLRADSPQCSSPTTCFGPVYVASETWRPGDVISDMDLLTSRRGVFVVSAGGPSGEVPMVTFVPIEMPGIVLNGTCAGFASSELRYGVAARDNYADAYTMDTYVYGAQFVYRIRFVRAASFQFQVVLSTYGGSADTYMDYQVSAKNYTSLAEVLAEPSVAFQSGCSLTFSVSSAPKTSSGSFKMIEPEVPDDLSYYLDRRGVGFETSECGFRRAALDENGNLVYPDLPWSSTLGAALGGGRVRFRAPGPFGQKYRVYPNAKYKDFEWSCPKFYPLGPTFGAVDRDNPDEYACNAPFPYPAMIAEKKDDLFEKLRQCKMLGGRGAGLSVSYCTFDVTTTLCRKGWYFFDETCYYRPNVDTDGRLKVRQVDADDACKELHPKARAAVGLDPYAEAWVRNSLVHQNKQRCDEGHSIRALITGSRCKCYDCSANEALVEGVVLECNCETPQFPLCAYKMKDDYIAWNDEKHHPATLQIMRDGQCMGREGDAACMGNERYGKELECECIPGNAGQYCERRTCIVDANTFVGEGALLKFAQVCENHGYCVEGQEDTCACSPGWGPPSVFGQDEFNARACALRMTTVPRDPDAGFIIDGTLYSAPYGICNGASAGVGVCDSATRLCACECRARKNLDPDGEGWEPAYDASDCGARTAMLPANGFQINDGIVERLCNGRGTACPTGERLSEKRLDGTYLVTVDSDFCRGKPDGCACDDGYAGHACTAPVPRDETASEPVFVDSGAYVPLRGGRMAIKNVWVAPEAAYAGVEPTCDVRRVYLADTSQGGTRETTCNATSEPGRYWCGEGAYGVYAAVVTQERRPSCSIRAYGDNHDACGNQTDARMARFFANEHYRDWNRFDEFQSLVFARHGATTTECACDSGHTGRLCLNDISSKRYDADGVASNRACGEETLPQRGRPTDDGCVCNTVAGMDFGGSPACACASIPGLGQCGGVGRCVAPKMPYGRCAFDIEDEANDPLSTPYTDVAPADAKRSNEYVVTKDYSVFEIEGESWFMRRGQTMLIEGSRSNNISSCHDNARYPVNVTYECGALVDVPGPSRAVAVVRVVDRYYECFDDYGLDCVAHYVNASDATERCDPANSCPTAAFCPKPGYEAWGAYPCLDVLAWEEDAEDEGRLLLTKRYTNVRATCAGAVPALTKEEVDFPYGVFPTCSDPVYRWLDGALVGAQLVSKRQCDGGIGPHDNTKGQIFGVFDNVLPGLDYRAESWTRAHYDFVVSLMSGGVCVDATTGKHVPDALTDAVVDRFALDLVTGVERETEVNLTASDSNSSSPLLSVSWNPNRTLDFPASWWGNPYWHPNTSLPFGPGAFHGYWLALPAPAGQEVRRVTLRNGVADGNGTAIDSLMLVGPRGGVCTVRLSPLQPGEIFTVDCGSAFESESDAITMRRLYDLNLTSLAFAAGNWSGSPYYLFYSSPKPLELREGDLAYTYRSASYVDRWRSISGSIVQNRTFPRNSAFERRCSALGGRLRAFDMSTDAEFVRDVHAVHLGARRCTHDWQCKRFARGPDYRCVPDDEVPSVLWLNGDPETQETVVGHEGGCEFAHAPELMDPQFSGSRCKSGYEAEWTSVLDYEYFAREKLAAFPTMWDPSQHVLVRTEDVWTQARTKCTLPTDFAYGRPTDACGGARGRVARDYFELRSNLTIYGGNKIKRCVAVRLPGSTEPLAAHANEIDLDIHSFGNYRLNVIKGRLFLDGEPLDGCADEACGVECIQRTDSDTHRVRSFVDAAVVLTKQRDFWTQFVLE